jgi:hypothetical protein
VPLPASRRTLPKTLNKPCQPRSRSKLPPWARFNFVVSVVVQRSSRLAYIASTSGDGFNVYGFNGKHLGWFVKGVIRDHDGNGACGLEGVVSSPKYEPYKSRFLQQKFRRRLLRSPTNATALRHQFTLTASWTMRPGRRLRGPRTSSTSRARRSHSHASALARRCCGMTNISTSRRSWRSQT